MATSQVYISTIKRSTESDSKETFHEESEILESLSLILMN